jgi:hypothetical protein
MVIQVCLWLHRRDCQEDPRRKLEEANTRALEPGEENIPPQSNVDGGNEGSDTLETYAEISGKGSDMPLNVAGLQGPVTKEKPANVGDIAMNLSELPSMKQKLHTKGMDDIEIGEKRHVGRPMFELPV